MKQSGFGIASLVLGIVGIILSCVGIGLVPSIIGLVFAIIGLFKNDAKHGMSIAGMVCSVIGILTFFIILFVVNISDGGLSEKVHDSERTEMEIKTQTESEGEKEEVFRDEENFIYAPMYQTGQIYMENECIITLVAGDEKKLNLEIENNSSKDYSFDVHAMSINGIMANCNIYTGSTNVPSQKKGKMQIEFENEWLDGIGNIEYIDLLIWVYDNSVNYKDFDTGILRITTNYFEEEKEFEKGENFYEEKGIIVVQNSMNTDSVSYSVINKNEYTVETNLQNCSINGWTFEPGYSLHGTSISIDGYGIIVFPNSMATVVVNVSDFLKEYEFEEINDFEFSLNIVPNDDYFNKENIGKIHFQLE